MTSISDLEVFVHVAKTSNMSKAGRDIGISPAVVSKRIAIIEESLNTKLFLRSTRNLTLTAEGKNYYDYVLKALQEINRAEISVQEAAGEPRGTLKITAPEPFTKAKLTAYIHEFLSRYKLVKIDYQVTDRMVDIIAEGFDLGIRSGGLHEQNLVCVPLAINTRILCAAPSYLQEHGIPTSLGDLKDHNFLLIKNHERLTLDGPNGKESIRINGRLSTNSNNFIYRSVLDGLGIALRPTFQVSSDIQKGRLQHVLPSYIASDATSITVVYPAGKYVPTKVKVFVKFLQEKLKNGADWEEGLNLPGR